MKKIYKDAQNKHVACSMLYVNDGKVYNDQAYNDQTYTSSLREAFKQNDVVVNVNENLYKSLEYNEKNGIGTINYVDVGEVAGKNKYPVKAKDDVNNITGAASKWAQNDSIVFAVVPTSLNEEVTIAFTSDSYVCRALNSFGDGVERTVSLYTKMMSAFGGLACDFKLQSGESVSSTFSIEGSNEVRVSLTTTASDLKMLITQTGGAIGGLALFVDKIQIEEGDTVTDYEPYTTSEQVMIFSAVSKPDDQ